MIFTSIYNESEIAYQKDRYSKLIATYNNRFGDEFPVTAQNPLRFFSSPGRTEIGGNHTDHNLGKVLAASINLDCIGTVRKTDNYIHIYDCTYMEDYNLNLSEVERIPQEKGSIALIRGILKAFTLKGYKVGGFAGCFTSDVIAAAGVSSSASFEMIICTILNYLYNDASIPISELTAMGQYAENKYWDKASGLLDQTACATGGLIAVDFKNPATPVVEPIPFDFISQGYALVIINTGKGHADLSEEYTSIPQEMKSIANTLHKNTLREVSFTDILENTFELREKCGDRAVLRALHYLEENRRVDDEKEALLKGDFNNFLSLITDSGNSSWKWLQNICTTGSIKEQPVALALSFTEYFIKKHGKGACRVHGGGFAGVIQAFIPSDTVNTYSDYMNKVLSSNTEKQSNPVYILSIRLAGAVEVTNISL